MNGTAGDDVATLTAHATQLGWFTFSGATFETVDFERPSVSLLIDALGLGGIDARKVQVMDSVKNIGDIQNVGQTYAARSVSIDHLRGFY